MDQDNALVFAEGARAAGRRLVREARDSHAESCMKSAVPYCKGGVMAKNPQWRGSVATGANASTTGYGFQSAGPAVGRHILRPAPVHGDGRLCTTLWREAFRRRARRTGFTKLLAEASGSVESAFGLFAIQDQRRPDDLKKSGLFGVVSTVV